MLALAALWCLCAMLFVEAISWALVRISFGFYCGGSGGWGALLSNIYQGFLFELLWSSLGRMTGMVVRLLYDGGGCGGGCDGSSGCSSVSRSA